MPEQTPVRLQVQTIQPWDAFFPHPDGLPIEVSTANGESRVTLPEQLAQGIVSSVCFRDGLVLNVSRFQPRRPLCIEWSHDGTQSLFELHLHLTGSYHSNLAAPRRSYRLDAATCCSTYLNQDVLSGSIEYPADLDQLSVEICLYGTELELADSPWRALLPTQGGQANPAPLRVATLLPAMQAAAIQLLQCPLTGAARRLYLESKTLELLALALADATTPPSPTTLRADDRERICAARDILLARLDQPPSLLELARLVGLNDFKLKQGFRQLFNTTVFGYLHQERMQRAHQLLSAGEMSVLDVALAVGYASPSRFSVAFRRQFGINPSLVRRDRRMPSVQA